jgi:hypothetical protein
MDKLKIISPSKTQLISGEGLLLPIRFEYQEKTYETYEPYFLISMMAKNKNMSIKNLLLLELLRGRKLNSLKNNAK